MKRILAVFSVAVALLLGSAACQHIPLYDPASGLYMVFEFDIDIDREVETKASLEDYVGGVRVMFYDPGSHSFVYDQVLPPSGGFVQVEPGTYDVIAYGVGSEVVRTSGLGSRGNAYAYTEEIGSSLVFTKAGENGEPDIHLQFPIINMPDSFIVGTASEVYVPGVLTDEKTVRYTLTVRPLVKSWTFEANNVDGAENIRTMNCYVTGQLQGRYLWDSHYEQKVTAIGFNVWYDAGTKAIRGSFSTFGKHPQALANVFLNITVQSASGGYYQWIYDVTDQFEDPDNWMRRLIISEPLIIPAADGGGVTPTVSDWNAEITHVPIN